MTSLVVFDTSRKCFISELLLRVQGDFWILNIYSFRHSYL